MTGSEVGKREREVAGSGKVHEPGFELGTLEALRHFMLMCLSRLLAQTV